ncbi:hypothetical protein PybrP1_006265 [[Pythium] brassicae (nom. inval.)]|nr:hypothetical protein PybrP1_006265 [[Pythium] brassicae (nom. inval.)]
MPLLRGAIGSSPVAPLLFVGCALLLLFAMVLVRRRQRQHKPQRTCPAARFHKPLRLEMSNSDTVLQQISWRKEDLNRFIGRLRSQLAVREEQLRCHDELEGIVTASAQTSRRQDKVRGASEGCPITTMHIFAALHTMLRLSALAPLGSSSLRLRRSAVPYCLRASLVDGIVYLLLMCARSFAFVCAFAQEWQEIMMAGRKLYGKKWSAASGDAFSLRCVGRSFSQLRSWNLSFAWFTGLMNARSTASVLAYGRLPVPQRAHGAAQGGATRLQSRYKGGCKINKSRQLGLTRCAVSRVRGKLDGVAVCRLDRILRICHSPGLVLAHCFALSNVSDVDQSVGLATCSSAAAFNTSLKGLSIAAPASTLVANHLMQLQHSTSTQVESLPIQMPAKAVSPQWYSPRRTASTTYRGSRTHSGPTHLANIDVAMRDQAGITNIIERSKPPAVPLLDFSRLSTGEPDTPTRFITEPADVEIEPQQHQQQGNDDEDKERVGTKHTFELTFLPKARLAKTLKRK